VIGSRGLIDDLAWEPARAYAILATKQFVPQHGPRVYKCAGSVSLQVKLQSQKGNS
jgi:hypothetical protein